MGLSRRVSRRGRAAEVMAIPHNGNLSNGRMFSTESYDGGPLDRASSPRARTLRAALRGHPDQGRRRGPSVLSPDDEFADFETWDAANLNGTEAKTPDMLAGEYAREALKRGLLIEQRARGQSVQVRHGRLDRLPHRRWPRPRRTTSSASTPASSPSPQRWEHVVIQAPDPALTIDGWKQAAGGLAGGLGRRRTPARRSSTR